MAARCPGATRARLGCSGLGAAMCSRGQWQLGAQGTLPACTPWLSGDAAALQCPGSKLGTGRALCWDSTVHCSHNPAQAKLVSPLPSQLPEVLEGHLGSIASRCSHHSSSCKRAELGSGGQLQPQEMGPRAAPAEPMGGQRGEWTPPHSLCCPLTSSMHPALLLQPPQEGPGSQSYSPGWAPLPHRYKPGIGDR